MPESPRLTPSPPTVSVLGFPISALSMDETLDRIASWRGTGRGSHVVTADASMLVMARQDPGFGEIVRTADLVTPDGAGVLWAAARAGRPLAERVSGVEIVELLCARSAADGLRLYFLGAAPGVADRARLRMEALYPGATIAGVRDGYFGEPETAAVIAAVRAAAPDVLCVALGVPRQERWIREHRAELGASVLIGVGGTFDVLSGDIPRAPAWMRRARLEWLWRVIRDPRKIAKVRLLPQFVRLVRADRSAG